MARQKLTDAERKAKMAEYYLTHKKEIAEQRKEYYQVHKEERAKYYQAHKEERAKYRQEHKAKIAEQKKEYYQAHKEERAEYDKQYCKTPMGRALNLVSGYKRSDKKYNRGECTLTAQWVVDNIFTKPCAHCGITGWDVIGCNRLDNSLPHTENNVEPCCALCNKRLTRK